MTRATTWSVSAVDRLWRGASVVTAVGPVAPIDRARLVHALRMLTTQMASTRVGWRLDADGDRWAVAPDLDAFCQAAVRTLPVEPGEDPGATAVRVLRLGRDGLPLTFVLVGDVVLLNVAHSLGDGYYMSRLLAAVIEIAHTGHAPDWVARSVVPRPLRTALWACFGRHPRRVLELAKELRTRPAAIGSAAPSASPVVWSPSVACLFRLSSAEALADLKRWRKANASGMSTVPITMAAAEIAMARAGATTGPRPLVLFDARRYVPRERGEVSGNFCVGLAMDVIDPFDPAAFDRSMKRAAELGRPLSALGASVASRRRSPAELTVPGGRTTWEVAYTHMGRPAEIARLPWASGARPPYYMGVLSPAGPSGITFAMTEIGNRLNVSASFHDNVLPPAQVAEALDRLCADPVGLLDSHRIVTDAGSSLG